MVWFTVLHSSFQLTFGTVTFLQTKNIKLFVPALVALSNLLTSRQESFEAPGGKPAGEPASSTAVLTRLSKAGSGGIFSRFGFHCGFYPPGRSRRAGALAGRRRWWHLGPGHILSGAGAAALRGQV